MEFEHHPDRPFVKLQLVAHVIGKPLHTQFLNQLMDADVIAAVKQSLEVRPCEIEHFGLSERRETVTVDKEVAEAVKPLAHRENPVDLGDIAHVRTQLVRP